MLLFLFALELIDTYKLLTLRRVLRSVAIGARRGGAVLCLNHSLDALGVVSRTACGRAPARR